MRRRLVIFTFTLIVLYILPLNSYSYSIPPTIATGPNMVKDFVAADVGEVVFTEHGSKEYLGDNQWRYRSSVGETNAWNGTDYVRYIYDPENKQVTIGKLTFTHGTSGVIAISHSVSGNMIGSLKWYAQYYLSDQWNNFTFDNYEYLGAEKTDENATVYQRWWSANGELNVSYTYYYWNELKMRAQVTNLAAQEVPVRVLWALVDIKISPDYDLIIDNGVAIGVELGNEQQIFWHDVTQSTPDININPVLDKDKRRAAVVFGNMSSVLAQGETMDIDPTYTVAADIDDDCWEGPYGSPSHQTGSSVIIYRNQTSPSYRGQVRLSLPILKGSYIVSADLFGYEVAAGDTGAATHNCYRIDETNVGSLEGDSSIPSIDKSKIIQWDSNGAGSEWSPPINVTDLVQAQITLSDWVTGYYIGFAFETPVAIAKLYAFEDYTGGSNHAYLIVDFYEYEGEYNYVDTISDLHPPSTDVGTHSAFAEMQDKDGTFDTLTEGENAVDINEYRYIDSVSLGVWTGVGTTPYIDAQDEPTNYIWTDGNAYSTGWSTFADTSGTGSGFVVNMSFYWYCDGDGYIDWELDWTGDSTADASGSYPTQGTYGWSTTGTISGLDTAAEIDACTVLFLNNKGGGGPDNSYVDAARLGISQDNTNYDLDLEVGWVTANYTQNNEELCIFGGTQGSEALRVDVWSGSWVNVFTDLAAGWNNISVASYLTDATFEVRFTDTSNESTLADEWQVEAVLLHTWTEAAGESVTINEVIDLSDTSSSSAAFSTILNEVIGFFDTVVVSASLTLTIFEQIVFSESASVGVLYVITIFQILGLAATASVSAKMGVLSFETIGLASTVTASGSFSTTINELINFTDLSTISAGFSNTIFESIGLFDTVNTSQGAQYLVYEVIGVSSIVSVSAKYSTTINELIGFTDLSTISAGFSNTIFEVIDLLDHVITTVGGANQQYVTIYEIIGISESVTDSIAAGVVVLETLPLQDFTQTILTASVTIFEQIGLADTIAAYRGLSITVFEIIDMSDVAATSQLAHYYVYEIIEIISSIEATGGTTPVSTPSLIYLIFFSVDMWGYLGPIAVVIGGYLVMTKDKNLGVIWFLVECLIMAQYFALLEATPNYWWQIFILLIGSLSTGIYSLGGRKG